MRPIKKSEWIAKLSDGRVVTENDNVPWSSIKDDVIWLGLERGDFPVISLPEKQKSYLQGKTASCSLVGGSIEVESRWIGFETESGVVIKIRVQEASGCISVETNGS